MIPKSRAIAASAIVLAAATHGLALHDFGAQTLTQIEGGGSVDTAALGTSFKDFTAGTIASAPASTRKTTVEPDQPIKQANPERQTAKAAIPIAKQVAPSAKGALKLKVPQKASQPELTQAEQPEAEPKRKTAKPPVQNAELEEKKVAQLAAKAGNGERARKKGSTTGETNKGEAAAEKTARSTSAQGNADASNYAGKVKRKILRVRRKSVNIRGVVLVTFRIADSGALASANIARSSGSKRLDRIALSQVRAAAPFPIPPAGARREYTIEILSK
ncbi:TonB family protein [Ruegeria profundi]|uniref:energy transducer TonB n=1 Tax=Ruegeria profundi TaxID=1685378 RepID=UPI003C7BC7E1